MTKKKNETTNELNMENCLKYFLFEIEDLEAKVERMGKEMGRMEWDIAMLKRKVDDLKGDQNDKEK